MVKSSSKKASEPSSSSKDSVKSKKSLSHLSVDPVSKSAKPVKSPKKLVETKSKKNSEDLPVDQVSKPIKPPKKPPQAKPKKVVSLPVAEPKQDKLYQNLLKSIEQYVKGRGYKPATFKDLREKLGLPAQHVQVLRKVLRALVQQGLLSFDDTLYHVPKKAEPVVTGILHVHPRGFAFLQPDKSCGMTQDVFIPKHLTMNAVNGDTVEVIINQSVPVSDKGPEGKVVAVVERARSHIAGIVRYIDQKGAWVHVPLLGEERPVLVEESGFDEPLVVGDRLVMAVQDWGDATKPARCVVSHHLGHISEAGSDISAAIEEHGLRPDFPTAVLEEARSFGRQVKARDMTGREDLRDWEIFTIDPETAKDYDDALSLRVDEQGHYHLGVHIADVSHYVQQGSALDLEAQQRCNSTYFPGYCLPMLPHELSSHLCSLCANVNRLTVSVLVELDPVGVVVNYRIVRSVIRSQKRFTYEEAKEVLDGRRRSKHTPTLQVMVELCGLLKKQRYQRGSIEFSLPELIIVVDKDGKPTGTRRVEYDITHQLVEEFMLKANELVAFHLFRQGQALPYRVHDQPSNDNMREFSQICHAFGLALPDEPTPADLQVLFDTIAGTPFAEYLANAYIRRMRLACYSAENIGHFGLSLEHYCHFTSPIRRYVDLVIHRSLFVNNYTAGELELIALQCSDKERLSARAEQRVLGLKKLRWLAQLKADEPYRQYEAVVTRVKNFGVSFEVLEVMLEGFLHVSELSNDYYRYDFGRMQLIGDHTGTAFQVADKITVQLNRVDFILLESHWHLVTHETTPVLKDRSRSSRSKGESSSKSDKQRHRRKRKRR